MENILSKQIAKHFREIYFGGNWTVSNVKDQLADVNLQMAVKKLPEMNSIAVLSYHMNYYVTAVTRVLQGNALNASDKYCFDCPELTTEAQWQEMVQKNLDEAELMAKLIEELPDDIWWKNLADEKYGNYYRNIQGIIEHCHYHLGQIVMLKKLVKHA